MVDFLEALHIRATSNQLPPPIDPVKAETERQLAEARKAAEAETLRQNLLAITAAKISAHQALLEEQHLFPGTDPAEIFDGKEVDLIANFLSAMRLVGLPGTTALASEEKRRQDVQRRKFGFTRTITTDETRSIPAPPGYLLGARVIGGVSLDGRGLSEAVTNTRSFRDGEHDNDPTRVNKVYLCIDGLLREVDVKVATNNEAYMLGQWVVVKAIAEVPRDTRTLNKQHADHIKVSGAKGFYPNPLVIGNGQVHSRGQTRMTDPGGQDGYSYSSPSYAYDRTSYLDYEGGLGLRLQRIIGQLPPESIQIPSN